MTRERSRNDDDRDEDRTAERMQARQDANRQAQDDSEQGLPAVDQGSREQEGMGTPRQSDGGGPKGANS
jgi:hypothetical protein